MSAAWTVLMAGLVAAPGPSGEPYLLPGRRLVFATWFYVRPGTFAWVNAAGENVTVGGSEGAWGATLRHGDLPLGIRLIAERPERIGPLITEPKPWETTGVSVVTLLRDGDRYRMWAGAAGQHPGGFCLFESSDGLHWTRPELGLVEVDGQPTNLLPFGAGQVFLDPSAPPEARYKHVVLQNMSLEAYEAYQRQRPEAWEPRARRDDVGHAYFIQGAVSPDGLRWTALPEPLVVEHSDTQIVAYYDARLRRYVIYTRGWWVGEQAPGQVAGTPWHGVGRRSIGRTESATFERFPLSELIAVASPELPPSDVLYTNCRTEYPGAPDAHLMFPAVWHMADDTTSIHLYTSPDGRLWDPIPGGALFDTPPFGSFDGGCVFAAPNLTELPDGSLVLPYTGYQFPHKYPRGQWRYNVGLLRWPAGRLLAIAAPERGEFATVGLMPPARRLRINALTARAGRIVVEVADLQGTPRPGRSFAECDPIVGDQPDAPVTWRGEADLGDPAAPLMLRFRMDRAKLYRLEFVD